MRSLRQYLRASRGLDLGRGRRMIAVRMGDKDVGNGFAAHGVQKRRDMRSILRPGIDNRHVVAADDVTDRAFEGEWAWIIGSNRPHAGRDLLDLIGYETETLIERDVIVHLAAVR
jgi:hypothetical protein